MFKKKFVATVLAVAVVSSAMTAFAATGLQDIRAQLNYDIKINYNSQEQILYDADGNRVYPISYNGTTYVPVRAVSNIFGIPVNWDSANNTVQLGTQDVQPVNLFKLSGLSTTKYSWIITDASQLTYQGSDATSTYTSGLVFDIWNATSSVSKERLVWLPTNGQYSTVSFSATADVDATVRLYDQDMNVITSFDVTAGSIVSKEISISGAQQIAFGADAIKVLNNGTLRVFDATAK
ncbi:MAG: copper amine oxidase N-terminal domain-containing protein [Oscillospiraceae bacterium]|nr:copper amine oxidase N-terminal domain-containing protein [Oscillospiraceae bacterium]